MPTVAIVIPVFNEEAVLPALFERLNAVFALQPATCSWRAILVDDGSRDRSAALIRAHAAAGRVARFDA
jgi:glycosyltransferase involved in cell wall biosynthesis